MKRAIFILTTALLFSTNLFAQKSEVFTSADIAIKGYDPVAYFTEGKPVKGTKDFSYSWKAATWYFSNQKNLNSFKAAPEKFAPQYGGYCAYGIADGHKAPTDVDAWTIVNGKLYLNYNKEARNLWSKDKEKFIQTADKNWPGLKDK